MDNIIICQWCFPIIMILVPILVTGLYFLRKSKYFIRYYGIFTMLILYAFCAFRVFVPIEFPHYTLALNDEIVFPVIYDVLMSRAPATDWLPIPLLYILFTVWGFGTLVYLTVHFVNYGKSAKIFSEPIADTPKGMWKLLEEVKTSCRVKSKINLILSGVTSGPTTFGIFKKYIVLPMEDYTDEELRYVLMHECMHIKNKDTIIKLLTEVFVAIFWWNPFAYLLKKDLSHVLEIKCDQCVLEGKTLKEKTRYCEILTDHLERAMDKQEYRAASLLTVEFAAKEDDKRLEQRIRYILDKKASKKKSIVVNILVLICAAALIFSTYFIQWRPYYPDSAPTQDEEGNVLSNGDNAYILHKKDGTYEFMFAGCSDVIPEEEIELGYYDGYPIVEEK